MPLKQYIVLKKAVEIESIIQRKITLLDANRAYHDPKPLMNQLEKELQTLLQKQSKGKNDISWKKDSDWKSQLMKYKM